MHMTPRAQPHHSPDDILVATLNALIASAPLATSVTIATDDGDVVYGCHAWTPHTVRGLVPAVLALALTQSRGQRNETPDAIDAALWELGMERSHALRSTPGVATAGVPVDLNDVAIMTTASDVLLLAQQVAAGSGGWREVEFGSRSEARHLRSLLRRLPFVSMLEAAHGSTVCVVHLMSATRAVANDGADAASLEAEHAWHSAVRSAVRAWLTATEQTSAPQPPSVTPGYGASLS